MHKTEWESRKKAEEIESLQRALNDAHLYLYDEREQLLRVYAQNDEMRVQELEDRRKIKQLLALTQPVASEVTYFPGKDPVHMRRYPGAEDPAGIDVTPSSPAPTSPVSTQAQVADTVQGSSSWAARGHRYAASKKNGVGPGAVEDAPKSAPHHGRLGREDGKNGVRVLRTIYMPNEQNETLLLTIESLRAQLAEREQLAADAAAAYREDRARLVEEAEIRGLEAKAKIEELLSANASLQTLLTANTKEYLTFRHNAQMTQRLMKEDNEALLEANRKLKYAADDAKSRSRLEAKVASRRGSSAGKEVAAALRERLALAENARAKAEASLAAERAAMDKEHVVLRERVSVLESREARERRRSALEREGFHRQIADLQSKLSTAESTAASLAAATNGPVRADDYELEVLNAALAAAGRSKGLVGDLNRIRARVRSMENRIADV